ncbi:DUF5615 family PIN-like protein [Companilactobacillus huachuanensis]|uniref:DUF5615 family PIN-like protein n=1 Tax=Companilactobacillus huachuanensis TaxID=2559914 RepID=A0ABW1RNV1_9LACO|nr:DUF5615 family PIN-like protein [Companilactobacillus huachuanensis]
MTQFGTFKLQKNSKLNNGNYLLDTNIFLYLLNDIQQKNDPGYSDIIYNSTNSTDVNFFVDIYIISEFINRNLRNSGYAYARRNNVTNYNYKRDYRSTMDFETTYKYSLDMVKNDILTLCGMSKVLNYDYLMNAIYNPQAKDFNDQLIINDAIQNDLIIITHDRDYLRLKSENPEIPSIYTLGKLK